MFSALRQNSSLFILNRNGIPELKKCNVVSISSPRSKSGRYYGSNFDMVVDIVANVDGCNVEYKDVPANLSIANDGSMVIAETKEAISSEVETMMSVSKQIIDSVEYNKNVIDACEGILQELNPEFASKKAQEEKILVLEDKMIGIENSLSDLRDMLARVLNK